MKIDYYDWHELSDETLTAIAWRLADGEHSFSIAADHSLTMVTVENFKTWLYPRRKTKVRMELQDDAEDDDCFLSDSLRDRRAFLRTQIKGMRYAVDLMARLKNDLQTAKQKLAKAHANGSTGLSEQRAVDLIECDLRIAIEAHDAKDRAVEELLATAPMVARRRYARLRVEVTRAHTAFIEAEAYMRTSVGRLERHLSRSPNKRSEKTHELQSDLAKRESELAEATKVLEKKSQEFATAFDACMESDEVGSVDELSATVRRVLSGI